MFNNIGKSMKNVAQGFFLLGVLIGGLAGILEWIVFAGNDEGAKGFFLFILILVLAIILSYLTVMLLYGFGELIENTVQIRKVTEYIYNVTYESYSMDYDKNNGVNAVGAQTHPVKVGNDNSVDLSQLAHSIDNSGGRRCSQCDTRNDPGAAFCRMCGNKL